MGTTVGHGLRYPDNVDDPDDLSLQLHNLADDVETALAGLIPDSGGKTNVLSVTPATGFSVVTTSYRTIGKKMWLLIQLSRTGAALTADSGGNFGDTAAATINDTALRPAFSWFGPYRATVTGGSCQLNTGGVLTLTDAHSGSSISTGNNVYVYARYTIP